jgi:hypothetical protein
MGEWRQKKRKKENYFVVDRNYKWESDRRRAEEI